MQPNSLITVQQLTEHLSALRREAAQARLVSTPSRGLNPGLPEQGLFSRVLKHFRRPVRPGDSKHSVHTL